MVVTAVTVVVTVVVLVPPSCCLVVVTLLQNGNREIVSLFDKGDAVRSFQINAGDNPLDSWVNDAALLG